MNSPVVRFLVAALAALPLSSEPSGPVPPCGATPVPAYTPVGAEPAIRYWNPDDVAADWRFPDCVPWTPGAFASMVTVAGRFRHAGDADALIQRAADISGLKGIRYWSKSAETWKTLVEDAYTVDASGANTRRADYTLAELKSGRTLRFFQEDNVAGKVVYELRLLEATPDRVVFGIDNASAVKKFLKTILHRGDAQTLFFFDRESKDVWRAYTIMRISEHASSFATMSPASTINRTVAYHRHFTGVPTDKDPPPARK